MNLVELTVEYQTLLPRLLQLKDTPLEDLPEEDRPLVERAEFILDAHKTLEAHVAAMFTQVARFQAAVIGDLVADAEEEIIMPRDEFEAVFVDTFRDLAQAEPDVLPPGSHAFRIGSDAAGGYYIDPSQRRNGPEWCAQHEFNLMRTG